ncbi:MAG: amino acid ABC transporter ATP-binding protein [Lachnospiraceae bacterium]|nr:amino acid ABC transporter ATP-binding protein [Lachnospiraceae bacterium]
MGEVLKIEHLSKSYEDIKVLDDISISVKAGEVLVIVGPSGCGKSTLLRCINGLEDIQDGKVSIEGRTGMVFQSYDLFPHMSVLQNLMLAPLKVQKRRKDEVKKEAEAMLERVGLSSKKNNYPRQLSGGQKQRVAIVRALIMHPEVLLFDEVTAALDPEMVREVLDVILDLAKQNKTMLIVTHEMAFARAIADRVIFLEGGKIIEDTSPAQFFDDPRTERAKKFLSTFEYEKVHE